MFCSLVTVITDELLTKTFHPTGELSSSEADYILNFMH